MKVTNGNQLIQVGGSFNSVMATITPMFVGILIAGSVEKATISQIFPVMYAAMAVFAFAFFVLLFVTIPEPAATKTNESIGTLMKGALRFRHFVLGAIAIFVYVGIEIGVPGTLNLFLTDPVRKRWCRCCFYYLWIRGRYLLVADAGGTFDRCFTRC